MGKGHRDDGADALDKLADICRARHRLDQQELDAVRTARRHGKSWAEIATNLGVTRQSAWERWRDLDEEAGPGPASVKAIERAAGALRRRSSVVVPNVVGMSWDDARGVLRKAGLIATGTDPDAPPLLDMSGFVVTDQSPESGAKVPRGAAITLWVERGGGGSGVREPLRPKPDPRAGRAMRDELSDEAVG